MGFIVHNLVVSGLQSKSTYVSIHGTFRVEKNSSLILYYTVNYHANKQSAPIASQLATVDITLAPSTNHYQAIYNNIKYRLLAEQDGELVFIDDL